MSIRFLGAPNQRLSLILKDRKRVFLSQENKDKVQSPHQTSCWFRFIGLPRPQVAPHTGSHAAERSPPTPRVGVTAPNVVCSCSTAPSRAGGHLGPLALRWQPSGKRLSGPGHRTNRETSHFVRTISGLRKVISNFPLITRMFHYSLEKGRSIFKNQELFLRSPN